MGGGRGRVLLCAQRQYYRRDKLDCPPQKGLNHYLPLNKTGGQVQVSDSGPLWPSCFLL